jgi:hypothetical protein
MDCPGHPCAHPSHIIFHADAKWPMTWHANNGVFQVRQKIKKLRYVVYYQGSKSMQIDVFYEKGYMTIENKMERNLLGVNKDSRTELMDLVFGGNEVEFAGRLLSKETVFQPAVDPLRNTPESSTPFSIGLLPLTLTYMTSVTVRGYFQPRLRPGEDQAKDDCQYLQFIATHATNLRRLTYSIPALDEATTEGIMSVAQTLRAITVTAKKLEALRFVWEETYLDILRGQDPPESEMVLDKAVWGRVALEVWQLMDRRMRKEIAERDDGELS